MINIKPKRRPPAIPMSAMSDIGFLLLIFIMLLALINDRKEVKIEYPEAKLIEKTAAEKNLEIWVDGSGAVFVDGKNLTMPQLEQIVAEKISERPDIRVHILADRNTPYRHVNKVVRVLQTLQHRVVSFVVEEDI
jgi:biopolymer transport protein ExbD